MIEDKKGSRVIYDILGQTYEANVPNRWFNEVGNIIVDEWKQYSTSLKYINDMKLRDFQFKINHKILVTKSFLYKIKKTQNNICSYCKKESESIIHLFCHCEVTSQFWDTIKTWLQREANLRLELNEKYILFSSTGSLLLNHIFIIAKYYIYKTKFSSDVLTFQGFLSFLKLKFKNEMYISKLKSRFDKFLEKWSSLYNYLAHEEI